MLRRVARAQSVASLSIDVSIRHTATEAQTLDAASWQSRAQLTAHCSLLTAQSDSLLSDVACRLSFCLSQMLCRHCRVAWPRLGAQKCKVKLVSIRLPHSDPRLNSLFTTDYSLLSVSQMLRRVAPPRSLGRVLARKSAKSS
jgi:hypothetical protein